MTEQPGMHLAFDCSFTHTEGRWRLPGSWAGRSFPDLAMFEEFAGIAERGMLDMLFFGDGTGIPDTYGGSLEEAVRWGVQWPRQDMSPFIAVLAQRTRHLGFGLTYSSTYMHPFYVARLLNSLDHVTGGRIAFNVVASSRLADAANFGMEGFGDGDGHDRRYDRMEEFVSVCRDLWSSVSRDAIIADRETGVYADPRKVHRVDHDGTYFKVRGPLNAVPSPQGRPVLVQAGASPRGITASACFADVVFAQGGDLELQRRHRVALDVALAEAGRSPGGVGILWSIQLIVAETAAEAKGRRERLLTSMSPDVVGVYLSHNSGFDFSTIPERFALVELAERIVASGASQAGFVHRILAQRGAGAEMSRDELFEEGARDATGYDAVVAGTAAEIADQLEENFDSTGARGGYMISSPEAMPRTLSDVVDLLVPELQRRGRFRRSYEGRTLAENLLGSPVSDLARS